MSLPADLTGVLSRFYADIRPGPTYRGDQVFDLKTMQPYNLHKLYSDFTKISKEVVLYLPRTSDLNQLAKYVPENQNIQVAHYCMWGASKVIDNP